MSDIKRRDFLKATAGVAAGTALGSGSALFAPAAEAQLKITPEKGAKLRVLRWKRFVQGDEDVWAANTKKFIAATGIDVRVDAEGWEDVRPKAAVAANVGSGPDIIISTMEDAHQYPDKLVDVGDVANYLGNKYGGWYDAARDVRHARQEVGRDHDGRRRRHARRPRKPVKAAGFDQFPRDMAGFLKLCQALKAKGTPAGFALGNATGDSNWTFWLLWAHGGKMVDAKNNVVINSPETDRRARILEAALRHLHPGNAVVARPEQQQGVPRRPDLADQQRHLRLLRGEDIAGPEAAWKWRKTSSTIRSRWGSTASPASSTSYSR